MTKLEELVEFHEITQLKYRYVRALDTHDWKLMEQCFTEDAHAWFAGGKQTERGRANIVKLLHRLVPSNLVSSHVVMHPELTLTAPTTATDASCGSSSTPTTTRIVRATGSRIAC